MAKVIERGYDNVVRCGHCRSRIEFELNEVKFGPPDLDGNRTYIINCPVDNSQVTVTQQVRGSEDRLDRMIQETNGYNQANGEW